MCLMLLGEQYDAVILILFNHGKDLWGMIE